MLTMWIVLQGIIAALATLAVWLLVAGIVIRRLENRHAPAHRQRHVLVGGWKLGDGRCRRRRPARTPRV